MNIQETAKEKFPMEENNPQMNSIQNERRRDFIEGYNLFEKEHSEKTKIRVHGESLEENKLEELLRPVLKHLCENYHPHVTLIVNPTNFELFEGLKSSGYIDDYIRD